MKKIIAILLLTICLCVSTSCVSGDESLYVQSLYGTYKLNTLTLQKNISAEETETIDQIKRDGIEAYLVIFSSDVGYYFYKDNATGVVNTYHLKLFVSENDGKNKYNLRYEAVEGENNSHYYDELNGLLTFDEKNLILSSTLKEIKLFDLQRDYSQTVQYKKVSMAIDFSYVEYKFGITINK